MSETFYVTFWIPLYLGKDQLWSRSKFLWSFDCYEVHLLTFDILMQYVVSIMPYIGWDFLLMQGNARSHTAQIFRNYLQEVAVDTTELLIQSPALQLNLIEYIWHSWWAVKRLSKPNIQRGWSSAQACWNLGETGI